MLRLLIAFFITIGVPDGAAGTVREAASRTAPPSGACTFPAGMQAH